MKIGFVSYGATVLTMADTYSPEVRRRVMQSVKSSNTTPELMLRRELWAVGMRGWRVNRTDLPGKPDIVFGPARVAVFVDGAFWHGHPTKYWQGRSGPYWDKKIERNMRRDRDVNRKLHEEGWTVIRAWDFEVERNVAAVAARVRKLVQQQPRVDGPIAAAPGTR